MDLQFLKSERFYFLLMGSAAVVLQEPDTSERPWYVTLGRFLALISAGFITVGTVDRVGRNIGGVKPSVTQYEENVREAKKEQIDLGKR